MEKEEKPPDSTPESEPKKWKEQGNVCPECKHPYSRRDKLVGNCFWCLMKCLSIQDPKFRKK